MGYQSVLKKQKEEMHKEDLLRQIDKALESSSINREINRLRTKSKRNFPYNYGEKDELITILEKTGITFKVGNTLYKIHSDRAALEKFRKRITSGFPIKQTPTQRRAVPKKGPDTPDFAPR